MINISGCAGNRLNPFPFCASIGEDLLIKHTQEAGKKNGTVQTGIYRVYD